MKRILVIRPDRLGDVLLSTPVLSAIYAHDSGIEITMMTRPEHGPLLREISILGDWQPLDFSTNYHGVTGFFLLVQHLRKGHFDVAIVLQTNWKIGWAVFLAGIPKRVGPLGKLHSYLVYNYGKRQKRSRVQMHEADYNLELLSSLGIDPKKDKSLQVSVAPEIQIKAQSWLDSQGLVRSKKWIAVHSGMGGSALNWPLPKYVELVQRLLEGGYGIVLTFGPTEQALQEEFLRRLPGQMDRSHALLVYSGNKSIDFLAAIYQQMDLVIAPSTGPLHLAVALGRPVVSFFPNIRVQSQNRWGPFVLEKNQWFQVFEPNTSCKKGLNCLGSNCPDYPCMDRISVEDVFSSIQSKFKKYDEKGI